MSPSTTFSIQWLSFHFRDSFTGDGLNFHCKHTLYCRLGFLFSCYKHAFYRRLAFLFYILKVLCMHIWHRNWCLGTGVKLLGQLQNCHVGPLAVAVLLVLLHYGWLSVHENVHHTSQGTYVSMNMFSCKRWLVALGSYCDYCISDFLIHLYFYGFCEKCLVSNVARSF